MTSLWSTRVVVQVVVTWQLSHAVVDEICETDFPVAVEPLWQLLHEPVTAAWSKRAGIQAIVL